MTANREFFKVGLNKIIVTALSQAVIYTRKPYLSQPYKLFKKNLRVPVYANIICFFGFAPRTGHEFICETSHVLLAGVSGGFSPGTPVLAPPTD